MTGQYHQNCVIYFSLTRQLAVRLDFGHFLSLATNFSYAGEAVNQSSSMSCLESAYQTELELLSVGSGFRAMKSNSIGRRTRRAGQECISLSVKIKEREDFNLSRNLSSAVSTPSLSEIFTMEHYFSSSARVNTTAFSGNKYCASQFMPTEIAC